MTFEIATGDAPKWGLSQVSAQRQRDLKKEALLECAAMWFHRHGFHGASLADIASQLGVTKPAIYHYAKNKMELLYELHVRSLTVSRQARDDAVRDGADGLDRIARLVYNVVLSMTASITCTFHRLEPGTLDEEHAAKVIAARKWLGNDLRQLIQAGIDDGSIIPCDPKMVSFFIVGAQNWVTSWYKAGGGLDGEQIAASYSTMVRRMLAARERVSLPSHVANSAPAAGAAAQAGTAE
jgi:TetR/AcrR family transcriptional regulator